MQKNVKHSMCLTFFHFSRYLIFYAMLFSCFISYMLLGLYRQKETIPKNRLFPAFTTLIDTMQHYCAERCIV